MPKAPKNSKLGRVARRIAAADPLPLSLENEATKSTLGLDEKADNLSRGQRRRQAKRDQYRKREQMILASLELRSKEDQKKRIDGLDAIREALMSTTKHGKVGKNEQNNPSYKTNKAKKRLLVEESHHLGLVSQHPAFKADPFETIQEHLKNTLLQSKKEMQGKAEERTKEEMRKQEDQKQRKHKKKPRKKFRVKSK